MANDGELDLNSLNDDDLVQQMHDDLYDGLKEEIEAAVHILLGRGWTAARRAGSLRFVLTAGRTGSYSPSQP